MVKTYVFGHKSPDSDSITSSLVMANLEKELGNSEAQAYRLGNINKETEFILNYLGIDAPELLESVEDDANVILVDHNSPSESVDNLENANILKVVDHHKLALETSYPLFLRFEPVGCTETILCKLYEENDVEITKEMATLMVSAIISDTLLLKSPTTTEDDKKAVAKLAEIAEIDAEEYGLEMLKAGTDLSSFSIEEILALDAKQIDFKDVKSIVNQVNTASIPDVLEMKDELEAGINKIIEDENLDLFMLLITDIVNSNSQVIALGKNADLVEKAYGVKLNDNMVLLEGVVSRKKQVVPIMTDNA
ncbi:manganese-dependent inorganic pyrophosphatase [uncultured Methanobrevibacter sp.]|uniref:manganese-dependent inorganic pyrophosphatase n=1 Tax=uncultured Methanobrevibacter sp. TaxID=253161 RepID=UPI0025ED12F3|nr:manganese-dependent inorganic pyrophosphatase [uncultured Methanobrevibacter sp.]MCI6994056.1 manganese-dependent inorganic pyrophosphatase [Methanobrevibacter sp.]